MGRSPGCDGCEALLITGAAARPHTPECWERITGILESTEAGRIKIARAQARMEQYQSIVANSVTPESFADIPPPAAAARWPAAPPCNGMVQIDLSAGPLTTGRSPSGVSIDLQKTMTRNTIRFGRLLTNFRIFSLISSDDTSKY